MAESSRDCLVERAGRFLEIVQLHVCVPMQLKVAQRIETAMRGETGGVTEEVASQEVAGRSEEAGQIRKAA